MAGSFSAPRTVLVALDTYCVKITGVRACQERQRGDYENTPLLKGREPRCSRTNRMQRIAAREPARRQWRLLDCILLSIIPCASNTAYLKIRHASESPERGLCAGHGPRGVVCFFANRFGMLRRERSVRRILQSYSTVASAGIRNKATQKPIFHWGTRFYR